MSSRSGWRFRQLMKNQPSRRRFSKEQVEALCAMGCALLICHRIEFLLARTFLFVLAENPDGVDQLSLPSLLSEREQRTLGQLMSRARRHFDIRKSFDRVLTRFLQNRNLLIHGIAGRTDYDLYTKRGLRKLHLLASRGVRDGIEVQTVLLGCYSASIEFINWVNCEKESLDVAKQRRPAPEYERFFHQLFHPKRS